MKKLPAYSFGFTLIELLVVISIIAIITGAIVPNFNTYIKNQNLRQSGDQIKTDLRSVQNRALTGVGYDINKGYWGVKFDTGVSTTRYYYFTVDKNADLQTACNGAPTTEASKVFPGDVVLKNDVCVFFSFANGDVTTIPNNTYDVIFGELAATGASCGSVTLNSTGLIKTVEDVTCP